MKKSVKNVSRNQKSYENGQNVTMVKELYDEKGDVYAWLARIDSKKTVVRTDWMEKYLLHKQKQHPFVRLAEKFGYKRNNGYSNNNIYIEPLAQYLKKYPRNVPDKIAMLLTKHPELVLVVLAAVFPTMLNIPLFKMLIARKFGG